jgi:hypothetical protein
MFLRADPKLAMDVPPSDDSARSRIDRQSQKIAPPTSRFAADNPIPSSQARISHPIDTVSLSDAYRLAPIDTARSSVDANAVTIDRQALCQRCRDNRSGGRAKTKNHDGKAKGGRPFHNFLSHVKLTCVLHFTVR